MNYYFASQSTMSNAERERDCEKQRETERERGFSHSEKYPS